MAKDGFNKNIENNKPLAIILNIEEVYT